MKNTLHRDYIGFRPLFSLPLALRFVFGFWKEATLLRDKYYRMNAKDVTQEKKPK